MNKNSIRTHKTIASKASSLLKHSTSNKTKSVAASALVNRKRK